MSDVRTYSIRVHDKAELSCRDFEDRIILTLKNKDTGATREEYYLKLDSGFDVKEAMKIDAIVYHMHSKIGLNLWDSE